MIKVITDEVEELFMQHNTFCGVVKMDVRSSMSYFRSIGIITFTASFGVLTRIVKQLKAYFTKFVNCLLKTLVRFPVRHFVSLLFKPGLETLQF
jgi:hypothetical protein